MTLERRTPLKRSGPIQWRPRQRKCRHCGNRFVPREPRQWWCSTDCGVELAKRELEKRRKKQAAAERRREKQARAEHRQAKERHKTLTKLCAEAQGPVNEYVRERDHDKPCISCAEGAAEQAGHFYPIGSKNRTNRFRFDTRNIHGQCVQCNHMKGGNQIAFREGLVNRYGEDYVRAVEEAKRAADAGENELLTKDEVREIKREHARMARELRRKREGSAA